MARASFPRNLAKTPPFSSLNWIKSSLSTANGNCVEVAAVARDAVGVRDSKDISGPILQFTTGEWNAFLGRVRKGDFDRII
jgi:hypothetical protein